MESTRSRSRSPDEDSRHHHPKPEYKSNNEDDSKNDTSTTSNMPVLSATATPEDEEKPTYNIWAGDLDPAVTEHDLMGAFEMCGNIHSASIVRDRVNGTSRGYGFVNFTTPESRKMALEKYGDSVTLYGRKVKIVMSDSKNSIYIGALPKDTREEDLRAKVQEWAGPYEHLYFKPQTGYAFVEYINHMKAEKAYQLMKNQTFMGVAIKVQPAQSREKKAKFQQQQHQANIPQSTTLFFKNIHESIDSDKLKDYVSRFGDVTKATVINNPQTGKSKGFGFVEFSSIKDSLHAQKALDGIMWNAQRLSVEFSVKDRDRRGGAAAAGLSGGRGLPPHLHPAGYGGYDMSRMHDPRDLRFPSAYDRGYPSVYPDRDPRDSRDRDRTSSRRTRDPLYDATPYYVDPRIAAAYGAYPDPYAEYGYADAYADYPRTAAGVAVAGVSARDYDRDRVRAYPDERLDERVSSRTLRERTDRERTPATAAATTTSDRDRDRIRDRDRDRYTTPTVPAVAADHLAMMDRYGAYALLEQQYSRAGAAPRAGGASGATGTDRDADYLRSQSRGYRY